MNSIRHGRILVAIETDATRYHGENARRPHLLDKRSAEQVLTHLSTDLSALFPEIRQAALTMPGALYDQTQLLRPAYPLFGLLESFLEQSFAGTGFDARLLSIGADAGSMPDPGLQPAENIPPALLQTLPLLVSGEPGFIGELGQEMEHRFLELGHLSAHSARALEAQFDIRVNHARFMTLTDLNAMLHLQLERFGFLPLWDLLDTAINSPEMPVVAHGRGGQTFEWNGTAVRCRFETFDFWRREGSGREHSGVDQVLVRAYVDWTREYRQYLTTLQAHAIPVEQYLPESPDTTLAQSFYIEESSNTPAPGSAQITEHSAGDLGTVAVTVVADGKQFNYYPLLPRGLDRLHSAIRLTLGNSSGVAFPGTLLFDRRRERLVPDALPGSSGS